MTTYTLSCSSPRSARGSAWTRPTTRWASIATPTPRRPVLHRHRMGAPKRPSLQNTVGCWSTPTPGLSTSVACDPNCCVPPPGWPVTVHSPYHTSCWVYQSNYRVGMGSVGVAAAALCSGNRRPRSSNGRRWLASLLRQKGRKNKENPCNGYCRI